MNDSFRFADGSETQFAKRQWRPSVPIRHAAAALTLGLLFGFLGPFRTGTALGPAVRYAFWLGLSLFGYACILAAMRIVRHTASGPPRLVVVALVSAVPQTFASAWALSFVQPGRSFGPMDLAVLFGPVVVVQLGLALAASHLATRLRPAMPVQRSERPPVPFLDRVPARLGRELIALEAEDHYLRVHTVLGSELILARLSDAVAQLDGYDGLQVHRSWWVAADAVSGIDSSRGRTVLNLRNGVSAPVSRTYLPVVRARAWPPA